MEDKRLSSSLEDKTWARRLEPDLNVWASSQIHLSDHFSLHCQGWTTKQSSLWWQLVSKRSLSTLENKTIIVIDDNCLPANNHRLTFQITSHYYIVDGHQNNHCFNDNWCHHKILPANSFWSDERQRGSLRGFLERNFTQILF